MKGTEKIIAHIQADAQAQVDAILAKCEEQCAAIRSDYEAKAVSAYEERMRVGKEECAAQTDSTNRLAQMEARKGVLALKQELISESFEKACGKIVALPEENYVALLAKLAKEAAVTGSERIVLNKRDKAAIGAAVAEKANALLGNGKLTVPLFNDSVSLALRASVVNRKPTFYYRHYQSKYIWWNNDNLDKQFTNHIGATLESQKLALRLSGDIYNISNF